MNARKIQSVQIFALIVSLFMTIFPPLSLAAQEVRGKIAGGVVDSNKGAVAGASVKITDVARGSTVSLTTNDEGLFQANYLLSGTYRVVVESAGFKKYIQDGVLLQISETRQLNIVLEVGGTQETVAVVATTSNLNGTDANLGQTLDQKRVAELPLVHGDPYTLIGLSTGVTYTGSTRLDRPFEPTHIIGYAMDGTRGNRSDLLIDGAPSTATANANEVIATYVPPSDIVQEFKVQTATFDAQFGNTEGGVTSMSIKAGTNKLHGTAYTWTEPGGMAANDFFGNSRGQGRPDSFSNRPGFSVSGPVYIPKVYNGKDKTFFLVGFEAIRDSRPRFDINGNSFVPTQALRDGNFSGFGVNIYDPATRVNTGTAQSPVYTGTQFAGNIIPSSRINPVAKAVLGYYSLPKRSGLLGNIQDSTLAEKTQPYNNFTFRVDQNIGNNDKVFVRGSRYDRVSHYNDYLGSIATGVNFQFISRQGVADVVHTFNATTFLNVRYGFNRFIRGQDQEDDAHGIDLTTLGFPSYYNDLIPADGRRFPRFDFPANTIVSTGFGNEFRPVSSHSFAVILNKALDKHSLKFGTEMRIYREDDSFNSNDQTGQFVFDNTYTRPSSASSSDTNGLQAFAAFLLGYPSSQTLVRRADYSEYSKTYGLFVQDDWRFNNKLSFNLGLRWEIETPLVERNNKSVSGFDFDYIQPIQDAARAKLLAKPITGIDPNSLNVRGGLLFAGKDTGDNLYKTPKNSFLPRFGIAYQLNDKTVLRAGFGLFAGFLGERRGDVIQPGYTQNTNAVTTLNSRGAPIPFTLSTPFANTTILEPVGNSLGKQTALGQAISFFNQNPKVSKQARFQIGLQRELPGGYFLEAEYVYNYGYDIEINRNINALPNAYLNRDNSRTADMNANNSNLTTSLTGFNPFAGLIPNASANTTRSALLVPFPEFGSITSTNNDGKSWYNSGQFSLQKRFSNGYTVQASYTWSKWLQSTEYLNAGDPQPTKMISDQDSTRRFAFSALYSFPFGNGARFLSNSNWLSNAIFGGWQIGGTFQVQSGFPIVFANDAFYRGGSIKTYNRSIEKWINPAAFQSFYDWPTFLPSGVTTATATPAQITSAQAAATTAATPVSHLRTLPLRFSNVRRDFINNVDLSLKKDIALREGMKIQLKFETLNAFNHPYFVAPVVNPTANNFGAISASNQDNYARRVQLGVKFIF